MRTRYDLNAPEPAPLDPGTHLRFDTPQPVSLKAKVGCGLLAGIIVMTVSSIFNRGYDAAEAAGAAQVRIAEAAAEARVEQDKMMRGASGMASAKHDWVFDH